MVATAAHRTFAIQELLERILIQLARQCPLARGLDLRTSWRVEKFAVVKQLFVLRRVNSNFKNGMQLSKELRRWMDMRVVYVENHWLHHDNDMLYEHHDNDILTPTLWLFSYVGLFDYHPSITDIEDGSGVKGVFLVKHPYELLSLLPYGFDRSRKKTRTFTRSESSWRNIKLFGEGDQQTAVLRIEVRVYRKNNNAMPSYIQALDFQREEDPTLGTVYDRLRTIYGRKREQHAKIAAQQMSLNPTRSWKGLYIQEATQ